MRSANACLGPSITGVERGSHGKWPYSGQWRLSRSCSALRVAAKRSLHWRCLMPDVGTRPFKLRQA